jgi:uncharacterized protein
LAVRGPTAPWSSVPLLGPPATLETVIGATMVESQLAMTHVLEGHRQELIELCRKHRVRRLEVFGSATGSDFDEESSDIDLLVEFEDMPYADRADAYLGLLMAAEALLQRHVDLVEVGAVRNPYLRRGIEESRELVYAA